MDTDLNHRAVLDKVNSSDLDETRKMVYRNLLTKTNDSVNGRTTAQKIQDITEALAGMSQILISREIDDDKISNTINKVCETVKEVKKEVLGLKTSFTEMNKEITTLKDVDKEIESQIKDEEEKPKKLSDKILDFFKNMPWSFTVLGLGICMLLAYRPELSDILRLLINSTP